MTKPRVLIDTNVLLSGLIWNGNESHLLDMSISGEIRLLIPDFVISEAQRVLSAKFQEHSHLLDETLAMLDHEVLQRPASASLKSAMAVLRDPDDAEVLASIIEYKPDYAITGDKDLLTPEVQAVYPTCTSIDFLRRHIGQDEGHL